MYPAALTALQERRQRLLLAALVPGDEGSGANAGAATHVLGGGPRAVAVSLRRVHPSSCAAAAAGKPVSLIPAVTCGDGSRPVPADTTSPSNGSGGDDNVPAIPHGAGSGGTSTHSASGARKRLPWAHLHEREEAAAAAATAAAATAASSLKQEQSKEGAADGVSLLPIDIKAVCAAMQDIEVMSRVANSYDGADSGADTDSADEARLGPERRGPEQLPRCQTAVESAIRGCCLLLQDEHRLLLARMWHRRFVADVELADSGDSASGAARARAADVRRALALTGLAETASSMEAETPGESVLASAVFHSLESRFLQLCAHDAERMAQLRRNQLLQTVLPMLAPPVREDGAGRPAVTQVPAMKTETLLHLAKTLRPSCFNARGAARKLTRFQKSARQDGGGGGGSSSGGGGGNSAFQLAALRHDAAVTRDWEQLAGLAALPSRKGHSQIHAALQRVLQDAVLGLALMCGAGGGPAAASDAKAAAAAGDAADTPLIPMACATIGALYRCSGESARRIFRPCLAYDSVAYGRTQQVSPCSLEAAASDSAEGDAGGPLAAAAISWRVASPSDFGPAPARYSWEHLYHCVSVMLMALTAEVEGPLQLAEAALRRMLLYGPADPDVRRLAVAEVVAARIQARMVYLEALVRKVEEQQGPARGGAATGAGSAAGGGPRCSARCGAAESDGLDCGPGLFEAFWEEWDTLDDSGRSADAGLLLLGGEGPTGGAGVPSRQLRQLLLPLQRLSCLDVPFAPWGKDTPEGAQLLRGVFRATEAFVRATCARVPPQPGPTPWWVEGAWYERLMAARHVWGAWLEESSEHRCRRWEGWQLHAAGCAGGRPAAGSPSELAVVIQKVRDMMDSGAAEAEEELREWRRRRQQQEQQHARGGRRLNSDSSDRRGREDVTEKAEEGDGRARWMRRRNAAARWLTGRRLLDAADALRPGILSAHPDSWGKLLLAAANMTRRFGDSGAAEEEADTHPSNFTSEQDALLYMAALTALWGLLLLRPLPADQLPRMRLSVVMATAHIQRSEMQAVLRRHQALQAERLQRRKQRQAAGEQGTAAEAAADGQEEGELHLHKLSGGLESGPSGSCELFNILTNVPSPFAVRPTPAWAAWPADPLPAPPAHGGEAAARDTYAIRQLTCMLRLCDQHGCMLVALSGGVQWLREQWRRVRVPAAPGLEPGVELDKFLDEAVAAAAAAGAAAVAAPDSAPSSMGQDSQWGPDQRHEWQRLLAMCTAEAFEEVEQMTGLGRCEGGALSGGGAWGAVSAGRPDARDATRQRHGSEEWYEDFTAALRMV